MTVCVPIRDLKDTGKFAETVEASREPITVTRNGQEAFIVMRPDDYDALKLEAAKARLLSRMNLANEEQKKGEYTEAHAFLSALRSAL